MCARIKNVKTGVDRLIDYLQKNGKTKVKKIANDLNIPVETVKSWVDFLVEERRVLLDYQFTTPYAELTPQEQSRTNNRGHDLRKVEKYFKQKAKKGEVSDEKSEFLWQQYVKTELDSLKDFFIKEAKKREIEDIESTWQEYRAGIL